jgi:hypothetical protein
MDLPEPAQTVTAWSSRLLHDRGAMELGWAQPLMWVRPAIAIREKTASFRMVIYSEGKYALLAKHRVYTRQCQPPDCFIAMSQAACSGFIWRFSLYKRVGPWRIGFRHLVSNLVALPRMGSHLN